MRAFVVAAALAVCVAHGQPRPSPFDEIRARLGELGRGLRTTREQFGKKKKQDQPTRFGEVKEIGRAHV